MIRKIAVPALCLAALLVVEHLGFLAGLNNYFYDLAFRVRGAEKPFSEIVVVAIDDKTLAALGRWPLPRSVYTTALARMGKARAIALDILMVEPSPDDDALGRAIGKHGAVVLPVVIEEDMTLEYPAPELRPVRTGHVHIERGIDGIVREVYHTLIFQGRVLPSLASALYEAAQKKPFVRAEQPATPAGRWEIVQADPARIHFYGGPGTFTRLSLLDVVNGVYPEDFFRGRIVLVGATAMGLGDSMVTPYSETRLGTSGVEIQASIASNLFLNDAMQAVPTTVRSPLGIVFALVLYLLFLRMPEGRGAVLLFAAAGLYSLLVFGLFSARHFWYAPAGTYAAFGVLFAAAYIVKLRAAAVSLGATFEAIRPHLRSAEAKGRSGLLGRGIAALLTPRGIQSQASVLNDITNQLIFEKELSDRILLADVFGVAVFDPAGGLVIANGDVRDLCAANGVVLDKGRERFMEGLGGFFMESPDAEPAFEAWRERSPLTVSFPRPGQRYLKADISVLPVREMAYSLFILTDVTKIKEVELLKGQMVSIVSHELKTPMTNIMGFSEMLFEELEGRQQKRYAAIIREESERLTRFVNTFLDINRIEEGRQQIKKAPFALSLLMEETVEALAPLAGAQDIRIVVETPEGDVQVEADRSLTKQCLMNLAENAIKYSPAQSEVTIRAVETVGEVRIDVADRGVGIRKEDQGRIFEKFFRSYAEETESVKGSGLGLTFAKEAMEAQGGSVAVESAYGKGSTFSLVFPKNA